MDDMVRQATHRDRRGRFVRGVSGNPLGRPVGILNEATRIATLLLGGEAKALTRKAIELALEGDLAALRLCLDRIIAPQREPPAAFALPAPNHPDDATGAIPETPLHPTKPATDDAPLDATAALAALARAAASGEVKPGAAEALARVLEAEARTAALAERRAARRIAARHAEILPRFELRVCVVMAALLADFARGFAAGFAPDPADVSGLAGDRFDAGLRERCDAMLHLGRAALETLATIPDTPELVDADAAFIRQHALPLMRAPGHPLAAEMLKAWNRAAAAFDRHSTEARNCALIPA